MKNTRLFYHFLLFLFQNEEIHIISCSIHQHCPGSHPAQRALNQFPLCLVLCLKYLNWLLISNRNLSLYSIRFQAGLQWVPNPDWVLSWKQKLPLQTIMRLLQVLVPQVEKICIDKYNQSSLKVKFHLIKTFFFFFTFLLIVEVLRMKVKSLNFFNTEL